MNVMVNSEHGNWQLSEKARLSLKNCTSTLALHILFFAWFRRPYAPYIGRFFISIAGKTTLLLIMSGILSSMSLIIF